ncbi:hypothetical protein U1Q18_008240, partial [Sarracenia purpurea var. burkii]
VGDSQKFSFRDLRGRVLFPATVDPLSLFSALLRAKDDQWLVRPECRPGIDDGRYVPGLLGNELSIRGIRSTPDLGSDYLQVGARSAIDTGYCKVDRSVPRSWAPSSRTWAVSMEGSSWGILCIPISSQ